MLGFGAEESVGGMGELMGLQVEHCDAGVVL